MPLRIALSIPIVRALVHFRVAGPILATHPLDLQSFSNETEAASSGMPLDSYLHSGPPSLNVETKLVGVDDARIEAGEDPVGEVRFRAIHCLSLIIDCFDEVVHTGSTHWASRAAHCGSNQGQLGRRRIHGEGYDKWDFQGSEVGQGSVLKNVCDTAVVFMVPESMFILYSYPASASPMSLAPWTLIQR